jgi:hypothetical protein
MAQRKKGESTETQSCCQNKSGGRLFKHLAAMALKREKETHTGH